MPAPTKKKRAVKKAPATKRPAARKAAPRRKTSAVAEASPARRAPAGGAAAVLARLESLGKEQTRKTYARHAPGTRSFGVSFADIYKIQKEIETNHELALALWEDDRFEARVLATMAADPAQVTEALADRLLAGARSTAIGTYIAGLVAKSPVADAAMNRWIAAPDERTKTAGYDLVAARVLAGTGPTEAACAALIDRIEREIHASPNRARYAMNNALIAIGGTLPGLRARAIAAARRIGKVEVDHGDTECKTPDAVTYIERMAARKARSR